MALTQEQYNRIMRIYSERQSEAASLRRFREEEAERTIPEFSSWKEELLTLNREELSARLSGNKEKVSMLAEKRKALSEKKTRALLSRGYPADYLELPCTCPLCHDKGYLSGGEKCSCFRALEAKLCNEQSGLPDFLKGISFEELSLDLYNDDAPMQDLPKKAKPYTQRGYMESIVFPKLKMYLASFDAPGSHNIFMTGSAGTGKTYLSAGIAESLIRTRHTVIYESAGELSGLYTRLEFGRGDIAEMESRIALIEDCDLLIIDDLGTEFSTELSRAELFALLSHRLGTGKSTIISSNFDLNDIERSYGERVASRIKGNYMILPFFGTDLRLAARYRLSH